MSQESGSTQLIKGRIVWVAGDLFKGKPKTDMFSKQPVLNNQGVQKIDYGFGLAVPKVNADGTPNLELKSIMDKMQVEAGKIYPNNMFPPDFAWKFKDGDTAVDQHGQPYNKKVGYAGHYVFSLNTSIAIKFVKYDAQFQTNVMVKEGIKCGDYVNAHVSIKAHGKVGQGKPGLYLNPTAAQLIGIGEAIVNAPSADSIFGAAEPQSMGQPIGSMPQQQAPFQQPVAQQQGAPVPHFGVLPQAHQPVGYAPPTPFQQPVAQQAPMMQQQTSPFPFPR